MDDTEKNSLGSDQLQPRMANEIERLAVPAAAERLRMAIGPAILPTPQPFLITAAMLQEEDAAIRTAHPRHFAERGGWICKRSQGERRDDRVEALLRIGESFAIHHQEWDGQP